VLAFVLFGASCAFEDDTVDLTDAASADARPADADDAGPSGPRVEVGTGSAEFVPLTSGQVVELASGPQGGGRYQGFHIWVGARTWELDPEDLTARFVVLAAGDRAELGSVMWMTTFRPSPDGESSEIWGGSPRLADCCAVIGRPIILRVEVDDRRGVSAAGEIDVVAGDRCRDFTGDLCP
jgi:hypothetical protein